MTFKIFSMVYPSHFSVKVSSQPTKVGWNRRGAKVQYTGAEMLSSSSRGDCAGDCAGAAAEAQVVQVIIIIILNLPALLISCKVLDLFNW